MTYVHHTFATPEGPFTVVENAGHAVVAAGWTPHAEELARRAKPLIRPEDLRPGEVACAQQMERFNDGEFGALDAIVVDAVGTEFQRQVWHALRHIAPGTSVTYGELAAHIGRPTAFRAVAGACGRNPVALIVPCHRVVASGGGLGGFAWGTAVKQAILDRERAA